MRFLVAALAFAASETALAHTPDKDFLSNLGHQLTSLHHSPAVILLAVLAIALSLAAVRKLTAR